MLTLHDATDMTKRGIVIGGIAIVGLILLTIVFNIIQAALRPPPPGPDVAFGKLPKVQFPESTTSVHLSYSIQTTSGNLPELPTRVTVNKLMADQPNLIALENATNSLAALGFTDPPKKLSDSNYVWTTSVPYSKTFNMNIFNKNADLDTNFSSYAAVLSSQNLPTSDDDVATAARNYITSFTTFPDDTSQTTTKYYTIQNNQLIESQNITSSQVIRVDFFQSDVNSLKIYYPDSPYSTMNAYVAGGDNQANVVKMHFYHREVGKDMAIYPTISVQDAYKELQNGNAYIAAYNSVTTSIGVTDVSLGYYIGENAQSYLYPVVVFQDSRTGFIAYVPAIPNTWLQK